VVLERLVVGASCRDWMREKAGMYAGWMREKSYQKIDPEIITNVYKEIESVSENKGFKFEKKPDSFGTLKLIIGTGAEIKIEVKGYKCNNCWE